MATHSSVLTWRIPGMVEPGGLPSMGSHRVEHDLAAVYTLSVGALTHLLKFPETSLNKRKRKIQSKLTCDSYALSLGN